MRELSEKESDDGELSYSNLDSDEEIRLSESDYGESEEKADVIDNIPVNPDIYVVREGTEWIPHNQRRSYHRISRINDTGPPSNRGPNMCNYSTANKAFISIKGPRTSFETGPIQN
ncbi:hypothetical protein TNCV_1478811 [Trichonephila clavipes]|nr:hypothetical protein TNCV_1478811 [Trichonephila clavipes]